MSALTDERHHITKSDDVARIEKLADEVMEKHLRLHGSPLDRGDAIAKVMRENPDLTTRYFTNAYGQ